ncbi:PorP/SprF family type IX secretion system membrane protein [Flavihumibacter profundi]|uniref:PorP/SprF family type IX secretion system membrane protein n=1 Tax=Flavihumibacter profundi TaxID=2716883 RepID=UPI001CC59CE5|nr:PorP/SprF family type IX secretion system membrane protein [Flavihumibacter profundi]MBZ5858424.1 PorP/SprF family type IX secretion system membrane protein [Flavihumibacter profundi]
MRIVLGILLLTGFFSAPVIAQDPHFSQFFASPLTLNPAYTGKFNGVVRIAGNYRDQWPTISKAFVTSTISVDAPIMAGKLNSNDTWGIGGMAMTDRTANGILNSNYLSFSTAYHKALDENGFHQLGIGFQGVYASKRLDGTQLNFENELALDGTWTNPSGEAIDGTQVNVSYFDFNAGMIYSGSTTGDDNFYFGASVYHINRPQESFTNGFYTLEPRVTIHGGGYVPVGQTTTLHFSAQHSRQAGAYETLLGGAIAFNLNDDFDRPNSFYVGSWYRFNDALIPYLGFEWADFRFGATYDVNTSNLKTASQKRGGIEISLIYIKRRSDGRKDIPCPKF